MSKAHKFSQTPGILVPAVEEVPRISDAKRRELRASLDRARTEIKAGDGDVLTPELLREEFNAVYYEGKSDAEIDAERAKGSARGRGKSRA